MAYGVTDAGWVNKPLSTIQNEQRDALISILGTSVNLLPESVFGQLIDIYSEREALLYELGEAIYNSQYIGASGVSLDLVLGITGKRRKAATPSILVDFEFTFTGAATVPAGATFSDPDDSAKIFETVEAVVATGAGTLTSNLASTTLGAISANAGTITQIDSPIGGLSSVTNPAAAVPGTAQETDSAARIRIQNLPTISINGTADSMENAVRQLNTVSENITPVQIDSVAAIVNNLDVADGDGRPPHSVEMVILQSGGATERDSEIAAVIAGSKPQGIQLTSTTGSSYSETVTLEGGNTRDVIFSRPAEIDIYVDVDVVKNSDYPADGDTQVQTAIINYINSLPVGGNVIVYGSSSITTAITSITGIIDFDLYVGTTPGTAPGATDNISINSASIARAHTITVSST
jgi:uncharacterized phage protein gp47/JayE